MFKVICISLCTIALCLTLLTALTLGEENWCSTWIKCNDHTWPWPDTEVECRYEDWNPEQHDCQAYWAFEQGDIVIYADCGGSGDWDTCDY